MALSGKKYWLIIFAAFVLVLSTLILRLGYVELEGYCNEIHREFLKDNSEFINHSFVKVAPVKSSPYLRKVVSLSAYGQGKDYFCYFEKNNRRRLSFWMRIADDSVFLTSRYHSNDQKAFAISISAIDDTIDGIDRSQANQMLWELSMTTNINDDE